MPVILEKKLEHRWLDDKIDEHEIGHMLKSYSANEMEAHTVSNIITHLGFNTTNNEVQNEHSYPELPALNS